MSFYDALKQTATTLLAQFGQVCVVRRTHPSTGVTTDYSVSALRESRVRHLANFAGGVEIGDWRILMAATLTPEIGDRITVDTESLVVVAVEPIKPAATVLAWYAWGRAG